MQIQIHAPHITVPAEFLGFIERSVEDVLAHFAERLTRVEVHLRDMNGHKGGVDKRCTVEARPRGLDPIASEHESADVKEALQGALEKLHRALDHRLGRLESRRRNE